MRTLLIAAGLALLPATAAAAPAGPESAPRVDPPSVPTPFQTAILGLSLTAVVIVGARATQRSSGTIMYMALASAALTGVFVAASHRIHNQFNRTVHQRLIELQQTAR
jgi:hypothetical protein